MRRMDWHLITSLLLLIYVGTTSVYSTYTNEFVANIQGGIIVADGLAAKYGFVNSGEMEYFPDHYVFYHRGVRKRSTRPSVGLHTAIKHEAAMNWIEQQVARKRVKRDVNWINDPKYYLQWYLNRKDAPNMNVEAAWDLGYTGKGVVVSILDDGIDYTHPDLARNYDPLASLDINSHDDDPMPREDYDQTNRHGTRCAGEVAMVAGNGICGVGVAYNASIGGVRMLDGDVTDAVEATSLSAHRDHIDIYSASWGPEDNGMTVDGPARLAKRAFKEGVEQGRGGKGSIFVWASGNGGRAKDNCGCDGYTNSIYTVSVSSTSEQGQAPWYLEECASTLATTYSSDSPKERKVITTDLGGRCADDHTGTSASAPLAAGLCALALQANPNLTWRDMQYIIVMTSKRSSLQASDWATNGAGYDISHLYGFGLMDAGAMVQKAKSWINLPPQQTCVLRFDANSREISGVGTLAVFALNTTACEGGPNFLEHVQANVDVTFGSRGALVLTLVSPAGTHSRILGHRPRDKRRGSFSSWPFMSTHFWGEHAEGTWNLLVENGVPRSNSGHFRSWVLTLYGTEHLPCSATPPKEPKTPSPEAPAVGDPAKPGKGKDAAYSKVAIPRNSDYFGPCHRECFNGCEGPQANQCFKCIHYRDRETGDCVERCPDGYYNLPELHTRCRECVVDCRTCDGASYLRCLSCDDGFFLMQTASQCVQVCDSGYYGDPDTNTCLECGPMCSSCVDPATCVKCEPHAVLSSTSHACQATCARSEYLDGGTCRPCSDDCYTCSGGWDSDCLSCLSGQVLKERTCVTEWSCTQGYFVRDGDTKECIKCHVGCLDCNGPSSSECLTCQEGYLIEAGACVPNCPDGYYKDDDDNCLSCSLGCDQCISATQCIMCTLEFSLLDGECRQGCGDGSYEHEGHCQACHELCANCFGGGPQDCTDCKPGPNITPPTEDDPPRYLHEGFCILRCPNGTYGEAETRRCVDCDETCSTCSGPKVNDCLGCFGGFQLEDEGGFCRELDSFRCNPECKECVEGSSDRCSSCNKDMYLLDGRCLSSCPEKAYFIDENECVNCNPSCLRCDGPSGQDCTACLADQFLYDGSTCDTHCPYNTYPDSTDMTCKECHPTCQSCKGGGNDQCETCPGNLYWEDNECLDECPPGKYGDGGEQQCFVCFPTCSTCDGPFSTDCLTCAPDLRLEHGSCVSASECPLQMYTDKNGACQECDLSCLSCTGPGEYDCTRCDYDRFLREDPMSGKRCEEECDPGFYPDYESNLCRPCHFSCETCVQGAAGDCMDCAENMYILSKVDGVYCVQQCPEGFYELEQGRQEDLSKTCQMCSLQCADCTHSYSHCISCLDNTFLLREQCLPSCPEGFIEDRDSNHCLADDRQCPLNCQDCNQWGECLTCNSGFEIYYGECMRPPCAEYQYQALDSYGNRQCRPCSDNCKRCLGPRDDECLACDTNYHLNNGQCSARCYVDQFDRDGVCLACHPSCKSCKDSSPYDCLTCPEGTVQTNAGDSNAGECSVGCPRGTYLHGTQCDACDDNCLTCDGEGPKHCLSCKHDYYLTGDQRCGEQCPNGTYHYRDPDMTDEFECRPCHSSCDTCYGPHKANCVTCHDSMYLLQHTCVTHCGTGFCPGPNSVCQECHPDCESCWGSDQNQCISCANGKLLKDAECLDECPDGYYIATDFGAVCEKCDSRCKTCNDMGPFNCLSCQDGYRLEDNTCYSRCDLGTYFLSDTQTDEHVCAPCHASCLECIGPTDSDCLDCFSGKSLHRVADRNFQCLSCCSGTQKEEVDKCCPCEEATNTCLSAPAQPVKSTLHTGAIIFVCLLLLAAFGLFFGILQARSRKRLCWKSTYDQLPTVYDNKEKELKITLRQNILPSSDDDYFDDDDDDEDVVI